MSLKSITSQLNYTLSPLPKNFPKNTYVSISFLVIFWQKGADNEGEDGESVERNGVAEGYTKFRMEEQAKRA